MRKTLLLLCVLLVSRPAWSQPVSNDHIFPPAPAAAGFINFDNKGFLIHGKRCFLVSAGLEYARVPHALWQDRLMRIKRAGFNCVEIYTFWNLHEPREGQFDFSGDRDLGAFLRLVGELGLYAIVRVGPYDCAEWDNGGYPLWLRFKPGVKVREDNPEFEKYTDRYFDKLLPIVFSQQLNHGGPVIMIQLENEHMLGWGTLMPNGYFKRLREKALSLGLEVPYFFSGLHHGSDPAGADDVRVDTLHTAGRSGGDPASLDDPTRPNPWFTTEFWSVWFSTYGSGQKEARLYERRTWNIIAHGGGGYNYYMAHGGSNFAYTNNDEDAASYDYGAAIGQAGDLRPIYYSFKKAAWFARSFQEILANGRDATAHWKNILHGGDSSIKVTARRSPAGEVLFFDNPSAREISLQLPAERGKLTLAPGEILPVVHQFSILPQVTLLWAPVRILGLYGKEDFKTLVVYGETGSAAELHFRVNGIPAVLKGGHELSVQNGRVDLLTRFTANAEPAEYIFKLGKAGIRILVVNDQLADRTWFSLQDGTPYVICGPSYLGAMNTQIRSFALQTESPFTDRAAYPVRIYPARFNDGGRELPLVEQKGATSLTVATTLAGPLVSSPQMKATESLALAAWQMRSAGSPAAPGFDDHSWTISEQPVQMGSDGDLSPDAWYRTNIDIDSAGPYVLQVSGGDRASVFIDGRFCATAKIKDGEIPLQLSVGRHTLAIFTAHDGRDKLAGFSGDMSDVDCKGLKGEVRLVKGTPAHPVIGDWRFLKATGKLPDGQPVTIPAGNAKDWKTYKIGDDAFDHREGYGWFSALLPEPPPDARTGVLDFRSVDENATVFLNGRRLARHEGWNQPFRVDLGGLDTMHRPIVLSLFIENYSNEGGIDQPVRVNYYSKDSRVISGWRMKGGIGEPAGIGAGEWKSWKKVDSGREENGHGEDNSHGEVNGLVGVNGGGGHQPCYYRTTFSVPPYPEILRMSASAGSNASSNTAATGRYVIWRVHPGGLGHGSVWVNGHNLGRYPEKISAPGLYIPECWLREKDNELVILDEDGNSPERVTVESEDTAGRQLKIYRWSETGHYRGNDVGDSYNNDAGNPYNYVDPFIGTTKSNVLTKWGSEGGTYPGAVAPWGAIQLTPETRVNGGYDFTDSSIVYFSCIDHFSGYPSGSTGRLRIMPVSGNAAGDDFNIVDHPRRFLHEREKASPGYYRVLLADDQTLVEATATQRAGMFRLTFPAHAIPRIYLDVSGGISQRGENRIESKGGVNPALFVFNTRIASLRTLKSGYMLSFTPSAVGPTIVTLKMSVSDVGLNSARENIDEEIRAQGFDRVRRNAEKKWKEQLAVIQVEDENSRNKKIFYTALYHAMLMPWVISDVSGKYRGADGLVHQRSGSNEYGGFSVWDTYRSLHPLLTLLFPDRQRDMMLSLLDIYRQTGFLPSTPMTGNHAIPVLVDSWLKGIRGVDPSELAAALLAGVAAPPFIPADRRFYEQHGYLTDSFPESVTRTVEYSYDDWVLGQFLAKERPGGITNDRWLGAGYNYRHLFDPTALFLLPRKNDEVVIRGVDTAWHKVFGQGLSNAGYKEGDKWVYSYFAPQHPGDLINLMGGRAAFNRKLDNALTNKDIVFDNETVMHVPYLFSYAGDAGKTQYWIRSIMRDRFSATPGGLPGNDDLGSMSSWYVFSALGLYPFCPGRPDYDFGWPIFKKCTIQLPGGKSFTISSKYAEVGSPNAMSEDSLVTKGLAVQHTMGGISSISLNNQPYNRWYISHEQLVKGGHLDFMLSTEEEAGQSGQLRGKPPVADPQDGEPAFQLKDCTISSDSVMPNELCRVRYTIRNQGYAGTKIIRLFVNGKLYGEKNVWVDRDAAIVDSLPCRFYPYGLNTWSIDGMKPSQVMVWDGGRRNGVKVAPAITELTVSPLIRAGEEQAVSFEVQNIGGLEEDFQIPVYINDSLITSKRIRLKAGELQGISMHLSTSVDSIGMSAIRVGDRVRKFKTYRDSIGSLLLDISHLAGGAEMLQDRSGFGNDARIIRTPGFSMDTASSNPVLLGKQTYIEVPSAAHLDQLGNTLTMMAWIFQTVPGDELVDVFAKGDNDVLQIVRGRQLSFFAGGWGRGDCTVDLPAGWLGHWHHIAGVCTGDSLKVYIDGDLAGTSKVEGRVNLSVAAKWTLGRNEEFPNQRIFSGYLGPVKVFAAPLTHKDIINIVKNEGKGLLLKK